MGHTHNEGGLHKDMARVEGAPRGMSRTHTCLYMAHGTSTVMCACVWGVGWAFILSHWAWGGGHAQQGLMRWEITRPRDGRHWAMCQAAEKSEGGCTTAGQQGYVNYCSVRACECT